MEIFVVNYYEKGVIFLFVQELIIEYLINIFGVKVVIKIYLQYYGQLDFYGLKEIMVVGEGVIYEVQMQKLLDYVSKYCREDLFFVVSQFFIQG